MDDENVIPFGKPKPKKGKKPAKKPPKQLPDAPTGKGPRQPYLEGTAPAHHEQLDPLADSWTEARSEAGVARRAAQQAHKLLLGKMKELGVGAYSYGDGKLVITDTEKVEFVKSGGRKDESEDAAE